MKGLLLLLFVSSSSLHAQNLIENGGFEPDDCVLPAWRLQEICSPWDTLGQAGYWQDGIVQYFGECSRRTQSSSQSPRSGQGAIGIPLHGWPASTDDPHESRGYPIGHLNSSLVSGKTYQLSYWVKPLYQSPNLIYATQGPGALFVSSKENLPFNNEHVLVSNRAIYGTDIIINRNEWTQVCMIYTAAGTEENLILGNFRTNGNTPKAQFNLTDDPNTTVWKWAYYLIDDVVLILHESRPNVIPTTASICPNEELTLTLNRSVQGEWEDGSTDSARAITEPGMYSFTHQDGVCERTDFIEVSMYNCEECYVYLPTAFTPNADGTNDTWKPVLQCDAIDYRVEVYDRFGNLVFRTLDIQESWNPDESVQAGAYVARVQLTYELRGKREFIDERVSLVVMK